MARNAQSDILVSKDFAFSNGSTCGRYVEEDAALAAASGAVNGALTPGRGLARGGALHVESS
jgi:hypothetical protein